jgi:hypothetical protein
MRHALAGYIGLCRVFLIQVVCENVGFTPSKEWIAQLLSGLF